MFFRQKYMMFCKKFTCNCAPAPRRPLRDLSNIPKPLTKKATPKKEKDDEWIPIPVPDKRPFVYDDGLTTDEDCKGYIPYRKGQIEY